MSTKNISITEEAYRKLASLKRDKESFSDIILRVTGKAKLRNFFGILSKEAADKLELTIKKSRKEHSELTQLRNKKLIKDLK